ncbi:MAG: hypothetical protein FJ000_00265 [Actinobacteria bacterium]|nr:hypothetical protein [Actinomycetota bacterium]
MKQALAPLSAAVCIPIAGLVAFALGPDWWWAAAGAGLACVYASIEAAVTVLGSRLPVQRAAIIGIGGVVLRMAVVLGALFAIGLGTTREQTLAAIVAFISVFTVALAVRLAMVAAGGSHAQPAASSGMRSGSARSSRDGRVRT